MKIMFICTGNICRSAMAEWLMKREIEKRNLKDKVEVCSSGIYAQTGDESTYNAIEVMKEYGVNLKLHKATNIRDSNIENMDLILCATKTHKENVIYLYPNIKEKVFTMKEYCDSNEKNLDIRDPWGYDIETYRFCASEIEKYVTKSIEKMFEN